MNVLWWNDTTSLIIKLRLFSGVLAIQVSTHSVIVKVLFGIDDL